MPNAALQGHRNSDGSPALGGSPNVFINGTPVLREGDYFADGSVVGGGAPHVFINGRRAARLGDFLKGGGNVADGCPRVRIGNGGDRDALFRSLTDSKDKLILCLSEIALAEHARANERDRPGWDLLQEAMEKWLSKPGYCIRDKFDNGGQEPSMVEWDWLMQYVRFQDGAGEIMQRSYLFSQAARQSLARILEKTNAFDVPYDGKYHSFDHTDLPLDKLRAHAFQGYPLPNWYPAWMSGIKPDGLVVLAKLTIYAVAKGFIRVNEMGARLVCVESVGLFIHDGWDFSGEQWLGRWNCENKTFSIPPFGISLYNTDFREFRERTGYGCDFRVMNKPKLYEVERYCYAPGI